MDLTGSVSPSIRDRLVALKSPSGLRSFANGPLPVLVSVLLVLILAYKLAHITWTVIDEPMVAESAQTPDLEQMIGGEKSTVSAIELGRQISRQHLFGIAGEKPKPTAAPKAEPTQETRLNLTLYGVFVEDTPEKGSAIIGQGSAPQRYYTAGEEIDRGVELTEVHPTHVVISRNGGQELLKFPKTSDRAQFVPEPEPEPVSEAEPPPDSGQNLREMRDQIAENPQTLLEQISFIPVRTGSGKLKGYRLLPKGDRELYSNLGVQPSDLITEVNGISLEDDQQAMDVIKNLATASSIDVKFLRRGQEESLTLDLSK